MGTKVSLETRELGTPLHDLADGCGGEGVVNAVFPQPPKHRPFGDPRGAKPSFQRSGSAIEHRLVWRRAGGNAALRLSRCAVDSTATRCRTVARVQGPSLAFKPAVTKA